MPVYLSQSWNAIPQSGTIKSDGKMVVLPGQREATQLDIPDEHQGEVLSPRPVRVPDSTAHLLLAALAHPIGRSPLAELVHAGQKILIVTDDNTRMTPVASTLPLLLAQLRAAGCRSADIALAVALGTHRRMTPAELERKLGTTAAGQFRVFNDPAQASEHFVPTGQFLNGAPVEVHHAVLEADFIIGIGSVVPHSEAGWSGGCKLILPGLCSERTVMANHRLAADCEGNALGQDATPVRRNMEAVVERIGFDFSINLVLTPSGEVVGVYAGHFVAAQRAAAQAARAVYAVPFRERADIVISNAYPAEIDFWQASKGIVSGELVVRRGGTVILNAPCYEGVGPHPDFLRFIQMAPEELRSGLDSGALADANAAALALPVARMLGHMRLLIASPGLPADAFIGGRIGHFPTLAEALDAALARARSAAERDPARRACRVSVLTHAGCTFPTPATV